MTVIKFEKPVEITLPKVSSKLPDKQAVRLEMALIQEQLNECGYQTYIDDRSPPDLFAEISKGLLVRYRYTHSQRPRADGGYNWLGEFVVCTSRIPDPACKNCINIFTYTKGDKDHFRCTKHKEHVCGGDGSHGLCEDHTFNLEKLT